MNPQEHGYWRDATALFDLSRAVQFSFTRPDGSPMSTDRVTSMTIRSSTGVERTLSSSRLRSPVMLPAIHVTSTKESRDEQRIRYTVQRVEVDGSNTVIPSRTRLFPSRHDRGSRGRPDLHARGCRPRRLVRLWHRLDRGVAAPGQQRGPLSVGARQGDHPGGRAAGQYQLRVVGAGFSGWRPVVVSANQTVGLSPVSRLDIEAVGALLLAVLGGLLFVGYRLRVKQRSPLERHDHVGVADPWSRPPGPGTPEPVQASEPAGRAPTGCSRADGCAGHLVQPSSRSPCGSFVSPARARRRTGRLRHHTSGLQG